MNQPVDMAKAFAKPDNKVDLPVKIEVAYARPETQLILTLYGEEGMTVAQAIEASGIQQKFPEIDLKQNKVGIFGKLVKPDTVLRDKDRVEIYRKLLADPKEVRRQRAEEGKVMKKGGGDMEKTDATAD
ncbi:MAG TPA: RnfH family protein [Burkholderiales bacterium]|nr:RnfH family protein [Burkholderiales bacterium]